MTRNSRSRALQQGNPFHVLWFVFAFESISGRESPNMGGVLEPPATFPQGFSSLWVTAVWHRALTFSFGTTMALTIPVACMMRSHPMTKIVVCFS